MADMRSCIKTGCRWPAAATLSYRYTTAEVWLSDLGEPHPATHDLCPHHADDLKVPRGWNLVDDRRPAEAVHEPSAAEIVQRVTTLRSSVDAMLEDRTPQTRRSRYALLLDTLPTYAAPEDEVAPQPEAEDEQHAPAMLVPIGVSHEMAPIAREMTSTRSVLAQRYADRVAGRPVGPEVDLRDDQPSASTTDPRGDALPSRPATPTAPVDSPVDSPADGTVDHQTDSLADGGIDDDRPQDDAATPRDAADRDTARDDVHSTGLRGAVVLSLPFRGADDPDAAG